MTIKLQKIIDDFDSSTKSEIQIFKKNFGNETIEACLKALIGATFENSSFVSMQYINVCFDQSDFINCIIKNCDFKKAYFDIGIFKNTVIENCRFENTSFAPRRFENTVIENCRFENTSFEGSWFKNCTFINCQFTEVDFGDVEAKKFYFRKCEFIETQWACALLYGAEFIEPTYLQQNHYGSGTVIDSKFYDSEYKSLEFKGEIFLLEIVDMFKNLNSSESYADDDDEE